MTNACTGWEPIYVHMGDILTSPTSDEILSHDKHGAQMCGWIHK